MDRFVDKNIVNSGNFNATILNCFAKFVDPFSHVFIFGNMYPESHGFVSVPVTRLNNFVSHHYNEIGINWNMYL